MAQRTARTRRLDTVRALISRHSGPDAAFGRRLVLTVTATAVVAVPFALALVLVESQWAPLHRLDRTTAERLHRTALEHPAWVRFLDFLTGVVWDPVTMRLLVAALVVWLLSRRAWRLATWAGCHGDVQRADRAPGQERRGAGPSAPAGARRPRARLLLPLRSRHDGHDLLRRPPPGPAPAGAARLAGGALGVRGDDGPGGGLHPGRPRGALGERRRGGWLLGIAVVTATTLVFEAWRADTGRRRTAVGEGLEPELSSADDPEASLAARRPS